MQRNPNQTFGEMMKAALPPLNGRDPADIARRTGFVYDEGSSCFRFSSLGTAMTLSWPRCLCAPVIEPWHQLVVLHYMDRADGTPPSAQLISFGAQSGGMVRGGGFDRDCEQIIGARIGRHTEEQIEGACRKLGARFIPSNADLCAVFDFLPLYPLTLKIWYADEEMDASGRMFLNAQAQHCLDVEDSVTVGTLLLEALLAACK